MTDEHSSSLTIEVRPILMDIHAENAGKIWFQEEIVISLTEMDRDTFFFQLNQTVNDGPERRIDPFLAAKPEIKKIPEDKEVVNAHSTPWREDVLFGSGLLSLPKVRSINPGKEFYQGLILGIFLISKVGVRKKKATPRGFWACGFGFLNRNHENHIAKITKMINLQEPPQKCLYLSMEKHGKEWFMPISKGVCRR
jgi:hypothetical protein